MIVSQGNVHDGTSHDLTSSDDRAHLGCVHAEDSALRHVDDRGSHHRAENATIGDGESTTGQILKGDLAVTSLSSQVTKTTLEVSEAKILTVAEDGHHKASGSGDSSADVNKVAIDHVAVVDDSVDHGLLLQGLNGGLHESAHEAELDAVLLHESVLDLFSHIHVVSHVNLVEGGEEGVFVLGLLETAGNCLTHPAHFDASLKASATDCGWGFLGSLRVS